ncbi:MAG TPA: hypothetical protein VF610_10495 [Segetibacter sp.]
MRYILFTFLCWIFVFPLFGQESYIRWNYDQQLRWEDFGGKASDTSKFAAETFAEICYQYTSDNGKDFEFEVYATFNRNSSWFRKEMQCENLLKHEQLHFNIAALFAEKLRRDFKNYCFSANYEQEINQIFTRNKLGYQAMQYLYDEQTNHSLNQQKQTEWEKYINSELNKYTPLLVKLNS